MKIYLVSTVLALILVIGNICCSQKTAVDEPRELLTVNYEPDDSLFPNPERGFYKYSACNLGSGTGFLSLSTLKGYRNNNISLVFRYCYLKNFKSSPISQQALADFDKDMETIRQSGMKCVLRFAYSENEKEPDAPLDIILEHLEQLKPYLERNADVIAVLQAGFIGSWGEWYYTTNGLNNAGSRYMVLNKLLESLPAKRMIQVRTPQYKREFLQRSTSLTQEEAFSGQKVARIGFHNDCFLASPTDYGTYGNVEVDKAYLNKDCLYLPVGGETCPPDGVSAADATKAQNDMRYLRWSFLNEDYYRGVNDQWITQGGMNNIIRELGYRIQLLSAEYSPKVAPGDTFSARIILKNLGYASMYNPRLVELVLKNQTSAEIYKVRLEVEPRLWKPMVENAIEAEVGIPQDMPKGDYELYLNLPDPEEKLYGNPAYSVRLANKNVWEENTGYNKLGVVVQVATEYKTGNYSGTLVFKK
ncbi:MAG TPA: DUF4832 domain-containing protein [Prolixibacteraceae bacterium]|nr:DUF4832 domain-containing protein [Prolixibacteraceae bacterium]